MLMPPWTKEAAAAAGVKSGQTRRAKRDEAKAIAGLVQDEPRLKRVLKQIDAVDKLIDGCADAKTFIGLTAAKERLWNLIYPKAGVLRPRQSRQSRPVPIATEAPAAPQGPASSVPAASVVQPNPEPPKQAE